jgi:hypothetical protein
MYITAIEHTLPLTVLIYAVTKTLCVKANSRTPQADYKAQDPRILDIRYCGGYLK